MTKRQYIYEEYHKEIDGVLYKKCAYHDEFFSNEDFWLPCTEEHFYKNTKNKSDGLYPECKQCSKAKYQKWCKNNKDKRKLQYDRFNSKKTWKDRKRQMEKERRERGELKKWQREHPEKIKEYNKARKNKIHNINKNEWIACKDYFKNEQDEWCCAYCGLSQKDHWIKRKGKLINMDLHKEHVIHNGKDDLSNCVPSCQECNSEKFTFTLEEWYNSNNPKYSENHYNKILKWLDEDYKQFYQQKVI